MCIGLHVLSLLIVLCWSCIKTGQISYLSILCADMAGMAPEGSPFDARNYDAKMNDLYVSIHPILLCACFSTPSSVC